MCDRGKIAIENLMQNEVDAINVFVRCIEITAESHMLKTGKLEGAHYAAMKDLQKRINEKLKRTDEYKCPDCGRTKAKDAYECGMGYCPKWYAIRDKDAEKDCEISTAKRKK